MQLHRYVLAVLGIAATCGASPTALAQNAKRDMTVTPVESLRFVPEIPGDEDGPGIVIFSGDPDKGAVTALIRFRKGALPMHWHSSDYEAVVVQGRVKHWAQGEDEARSPILAPGSHWFQPAIQVHTDACLEEQVLCMVFVRTYGKLDMTPVEGHGLGPK